MKIHLGNMGILPVVTPLSASLSEGERGLGSTSVFGGHPHRMHADPADLADARRTIGEYERILSEANFILKTDKDTNITFISEHFCWAIGYKPAEIVGSPYIQQIAMDATHALCNISHRENHIVGIGEIQNEPIAQVFRSLKGGAVWRGIIKNRTKIGSYLWGLATIIPLFDEGCTEVREYIIVQTDVTDIEIAKQQLKKGFQKLQDIDTKKDEFLNIASHELRTPLSSIRGYLSMILDGDLGEVSPEVRDCIDRLSQTTERLIQLTNDMLDISKLEAGKQEMFIEPVSVVPCIREVVGGFSGIATAKKLSFVEDITCHEEFLTIDANKLRQILVHLIGNAVKFTPEGGTVTIRLKRSDKFLFVIVQDTGIGIDSQDFSKIFEKFGQVKSSLTRDNSGTGLGLPLVKHLVELFNGTIEIESELQKGSTFTLTFPRTHTH